MFLKVKGSAFGDASGRLDPKVLARTKKKAPIPDSDVAKEIRLADFDLLQLRASMGGNNLDLTHEKITEKDILIPCKDRYLPARLYFFSRSTVFQDCLLYMHGGGFVGGSVATMNNQCRLLAEETGAVVISLEYRLAPETMFPGQYYDAKEAINWIATNHDELNFKANQIYVAGDSAGATLAITCGLTDTKHQVKHIFSIYGALDFTAIEDTIYHWRYEDYPMVDNEKELIHTRLNRFAILSKLIQKIYVGDAKMDDPLVNPVYADDFTNLPAITLIEAEFDYFLQSNKYFAKKAEQHHVPVQEVLYEGLDHGFFDRLGHLEQAGDVVKVIASEMN